MRSVYLGQFTDETANAIAGELEEAGIAWSYKQPGFFTRIFFMGEWGTRMFVDAGRLGRKVGAGYYDYAEDGTRGSRQYVEYARGGEPGDSAGRQGSPRLKEIDAMVLFDLVGDCDLQVPREAGSSRALYDEFTVAAEVSAPPELDVLPLLLLWPEFELLPLWLVPLPL